MNVETRPYADMSAHYLGQASAELASGDLLQASEKGWGAAAQIIKAIAQERGWEHLYHRQLIAAVQRIADETGDQDFLVSFGAARSLHENFYEGQLHETGVRRLLTSTMEFVTKMRALIE